MKLSNNIKTSLICFLMLGATVFAQVPAQTQTEVSDGELNKIASIFKELQTINLKGEQKMTEAVEANGFEVNRFNEMFEASQSPDKNIEATAEEKEKYGVLMNEIQQIQAGLQEEMESVITDEGLTMERYQQVATAVQTDTKLQQRLQNVLANQGQQ